MVASLQCLVYHKTQCNQISNTVHCTGVWCSVGVWTGLYLPTTVIPNSVLTFVPLTFADCYGGISYCSWRSWASSTWTVPQTLSMLNACWLVILFTGVSLKATDSCTMKQAARFCMGSPVCGTCLDFGGIRSLYFTNNIASLYKHRIILLWISCWFLFQLIFCTADCVHFWWYLYIPLGKKMSVSNAELILDDVPDLFTMTFFTILHWKPYYFKGFWYSLICGLNLNYLMVLCQISIKHICVKVKPV